MRSTRSAARKATNILTETPDEVAMAIACQLDCPLDLLPLGMACKRFRLKTVADPDHDSSGAAGGAPEMWSIVSEAARRWLAAQPEAERNRCRAGRRTAGWG